MAHSEIGPSGASTWFDCPASVQMNRDAQKYIKQVVNLPACEGTAGHAMGEHCLKNDCDMTDIEGMVFKGYSEDEDLPEDFKQMYVVDDEFIEKVQVYIDYVRGLDLDYIMIEKAMNLFYRDGEKGTGDVIGYEEATKTLHVIDLKYGENVAVVAEGNKQGVLYGLCALDEYDLEFNIKVVKIHIVQPRMYTGITTAEYTVKELEELRQPFINVVKTIDSGEAVTNFNPSPSACQWCDASGTCKALADSTLKNCIADFDKLEGQLEEIDLDDEKLITPAGILTNDQIGKILRLKPRLKKFLDEVTEIAKAKLEQGEGVRGWKMVENNRRSWTDQSEDSDLAKWLCRQVTKKEAYKQKLLTPVQALKKIAEVHGKVSTRTQNKFDTFITYGKPSLVKESDKREAISSVMDDLNDIDAEIDRLEDLRTPPVEVEEFDFDDL